MIAQHTHSYVFARFLRYWGVAGYSNSNMWIQCLALHHHHHISVTELGHLLTRSGLTYPEVSSKVCHNSFCQLENSVSLPWVIYYEALYLHVVSSFSCIPVICPNWCYFYFLCNLCICFVISPSDPAVLLIYFNSAALNTLKYTDQLNGIYIYSKILVK